MKEVFVFGAGASHASARTPLGRNLLWTYYQDCVLFYQMGSNGNPTDDWTKEVRKEFENLLCFLQSKSEFKKYADQLERMMRGEPDSDFDVEKRYSVVELMKDFSKEKNDKMTQPHLPKSAFPYINT